MDCYTGLNGIKENIHSYLTHYDILLQNAKDIIKKCDSYFITRCGRSLLQNAAAIALQNVTEVYYKMRRFFISKCDSFITKCDSYYKMRRLLQIPKVH